MDITALQSLIETKQIPVSENSDGFLEIIRKQHHENINSSIYTHFINCTEEPVRSAFLGALVILVNKKSDRYFTIIDAFAQTEVNTGKGRIDILVKEKSGNQTIIIENKIYHWLNNDLKDYWDFIKISESSKVGVLLTLKPYLSELEQGFVNITHLEWVTEVKNNLIISELPINYQVYVSDFIRTIENLSTSYAMNESAKFYFEHPQEMLSAQETINEAHSFLNNQLELAASKLGWNCYGNSIDWRNFWDEKNALDTYLTVITGNLLKGNHCITLIIELKRKDKDREEDVKKHIVNHPQISDKYRGESKWDYAHFLCKNYPITDNDLKDLGNFIAHKVKEDFGDILLEIIEFLYPDKDFSAWKQNFQKASSENLSGN